MKHSCQNRKHTCGSAKCAGITLLRFEEANTERAGCVFESPRAAVFEPARLEQLELVDVLPRAHEQDRGARRRHGGQGAASLLLFFLSCCSERKERDSKLCEWRLLGQLWLCRPGAALSTSPSLVASVRPRRSGAQVRPPRSLRSRYPWISTRGYPLRLRARLGVSVHLGHDHRPDVHGPAEGRGLVGHGLRRTDGQRYSHWLVQWVCCGLLSSLTGGVRALCSVGRSPPCSLVSQHISHSRCTLHSPRGAFC